MTVVEGRKKASAGRATSPWGPFRHRAFRILWIATLVSNVGNWMYSAAAAWHMTLLAPSPLMVSLVQAATTLPVFLFALPAGALADIIDRRKLLLVNQIGTLLLILLLGVLSPVGLVTPILLLAFTFAAGVGAAVTAPTWQAIVPELVSKSDLQAAIALNSVAVNISRAIGPALAGALIAAFGIAWPYLVDAVTFLTIIAALVWWNREQTTTHLPAERLVGAIRAGVLYARGSAPLRATLIRTIGFVLFASAYWALLPLIARGLPNGGAQLYGVLLGCIGVGAVAGALVLPRLRGQVDADQVVIAGTVVTAAVMAVLGTLANTPAVLIACLSAGLAWVAVFSTLSVSVQTTLPEWVRARGLALYMMVFFGGMTGGSALWGHVAETLGIPASLTIAAAGGLIAVVLTRRWRLERGQPLDLAPSMHWPAPIVAQNVEHDRGPVLVTVEYRIDPARASGFVRAMRELSDQRRRNGAYAWGVFEDAAEPSRYLECFMVESWIEHLRQHARVTAFDREIEDRVRAFLTAGERPVVSHLLAPDRRRED